MMIEDKTYNVDEIQKHRSECVESARKMYNLPGTEQWLKDILVKEYPEIAESKSEFVRKMILQLVKKHAVNHERCIMEDWLADHKETPEYLSTESEIVRPDGSIERHSIPYLKLKYDADKLNNQFLKLMNIKISRDGNQVCVLLGDDLAEGIAGFGDTLEDAVKDFKKSWYDYNRYRKATWKPTNEQLKALGSTLVFYKDNPQREVLETLYDELQKQ